MSVRFDYGNLIEGNVVGGLVAERLSADLADRFVEVRADFDAQRAEGRLGFPDLPDARDVVERISSWAAACHGAFDDVVVLGIGGSGLGATAVKEALLGPFWNSRSDEARDGRPRLHVLDNPDPVTTSALLAGLEPGRTLFNVVSKSGATAETMAVYLVAREWIEATLGPDAARDHFVFTTDPVSGALRTIGDAEGIEMFAVPENVGGRFSVLSAVGLVPAALCGIDIGALLDGAARAVQRCGTSRLTDNAAGLFATLLHLADVDDGRPIHVLMPYCDRLRPVALWFQQLWAESLGKFVPDGSGRAVGPTPVAASGATDQHSVLQLLMEGPHDKVVILMSVDDPGVDVEIPRRHADVPAIAYLGGHTLGALLDTERRATAEALRRADRPNGTLALSRVDASTLGELFMVLQIATVYAGTLYGIDPLDQPGVELGKKLTYGLMGREGSERPVMTEPDGRWVV